MSRLRFIATAPQGVADLLAAELAGLGAGAPREAGARVRFSGDLACGYRACLWSRLASRVLLEVATVPLGDADALYGGARGVLWREHLGAESSFAVAAEGRHPAFRDPRFAALRVKDAIADQFRDALGRRPRVEAADPEVRVRVLLGREAATLCIDISGPPLHERGYRRAAGPAPLKEPLAAAVLARAGWAGLADRGAAFLDPLCGSGTLAIEAALVAANLAPGLGRRRWGFERWGGHDPDLWQRLLEEARAARRAPRVALLASDRDPGAVAAARTNAAAAGVGEWLRIERRELAENGAAGARAGPGLLATNPPYGKRLTDRAAAEHVHRTLARLLAGPLAAWHAAVLTTRPEALRGAGRRRRRSHRLRNGPLACTLVRLEPLAAPYPPVQR